MVKTLAILLALFLGSFALGVNPAMANDCPSEYSASACDAWKQAQARGEYKGAVKETTEPMSCAIMYQKEPSALTVYEGSYARRNDGRIITTFRNTGWVQKSKNVWAKTICIPKRQMKDVMTFTICGSVGHYFFNSEEAGYFKRQNGSLGSDDIARMWAGG
jgi:hypothetical protein